ncbi:DNA ligase D [Pseudomonas massiliensis]|uniref:DNA ligase D n=1 Tax=Pseudomonas massiliensis TaxID=522492 RepID=UPI00058D3A6B|nr:DNA ligase D [Pseudomonas massiliensis]
MSDALQEYNRKRDFEATPEPSGKARPGKVQDAEHALQFCIQKHDASHLHYDFRLELDGTLKSWAVPKGPSLDPRDRRLAIQVEDHPIDYASFEGHIPEGHYGAGDVIVWDRGVWQPEEEPHKAFEKGRLKFRLQGEKLSGVWNLVRTGMSGSKQQWFLIKSHDEAARDHDQYDVLEAAPDSVISDRTLVPRARGKAASTRMPAKTPSRSRSADTKPATSVGRPPASSKKRGALEGAVAAPLPETLTPELATLVESAPAGEWTYEIKFDGYRILARIDQGEVRLFTRNGHDWTARLPRQAQALKALGLESAWLDGEVIVNNDEGVPAFQSLQNAFESDQAQAIVYYLFDLVYLNGMDLSQAPLEQRRAALDKLLQANQDGGLRFSASFDEAATSLLDSACSLKMEGLIGKRLGSPYVSRRSNDWIKLKCKHRQEFVVVGYTEPRGSRSAFGALLLGLHDADSGELRYAGKVGTGFNEHTLKTIHARLQPLEVKKPALANPPKGAEARGVHWLKPTQLAEVAYAEMTREGSVRHAVFHGLRQDKPATEIIQETPMDTAKLKAEKASTKTTAKAASARTGARGAGEAKPAPLKASRVGKHEAPAGEIRITHPDRVIDATSGTTKLQLAQYYAQVAAWILPHLERRPVALVRAPEGIAGELFFQKHAERLKIPGISTLGSAFSGQPVMVVDNPQALLGAVQMSTVEFHTWNATSKDGQHPDRFVLDLDPDPALPWKAMVEATQLTLTVLDELGLKSFLKTSGGKGMHIVVPLKPKDDWESVKAFSHAIVSHLARLLPDRFSEVAGPKNRVGKIFVDYLRNSQGATTICAFAARTREGLPVSVPVSREEVAGLKGGNQWNIHNIHERLAEMEGNDPWEGYAKVRQTITATMRKKLNMKN